MKKTREPTLRKPENRYEKNNWFETGESRASGQAVEDTRDQPAERGCWWGWGGGKDTKIKSTAESPGEAARSEDTVSHHFSALETIIYSPSHRSLEVHSLPRVSVLRTPGS